jgi:hypothetical protein
LSISKMAVFQLSSTATCPKLRRLSRLDS